MQPRVCLPSAAENANAIEAELSYGWAPAADMALTVAPTSLFKATTCRFSCGPLCTTTEKLIAQPVRRHDDCQRKTSICKLPLIASY